VGLGSDSLDEGDGRLMASTANKIAFCFPGQGSIEAGMGLDIAEAVPEAMDVYRRGSLASGLDLEYLCFRGSGDDLVDTAVQQPALVATSLAMLAAIRARGIEPDFVVGHSVGEFAAIAAARSMTVEEALELVRERAELLVHRPPRFIRSSVLRYPNPALLHRIHDGLRAVVDRQLAQDRAHVVLDGLLADRQGIGNLLVGHAPGDVVEDLDLARRQRSEDRR